MAGTNDGFVSKLKSDLSGPLQASTYIGGPNGSSYSKAITCSGGEVYIAGYTTSANYPTTPGAYQLNLKSQDAFVTRLNSTLSGPLVASTYLGGSSSEYGTAVAVREGNVYVAGYSNSTDYPVTSGVYQGTKAGVNDAFVAELTGPSSSHLTTTQRFCPTSRLTRGHL
ncbi:MAG: Beta-propeller repeat protein [Pelotomaculum sp. PtaB.Bin104]|nr:MAG: Beta-propeller repeat protein [Pelotomaculum sp. PtaB.Bin104]